MVLFDRGEKVVRRQAGEPRLIVGQIIVQAERREELAFNRAINGFGIDEHAVAIENHRGKGHGWLTSGSPQTDL